MIFLDGWKGLSSLTDTVCISFVPISPTLTISLMGVTRPTTSPDWHAAWTELPVSVCPCVRVCVHATVCVKLIEKPHYWVVLRWDTKALAEQTDSCLSFFSAFARQQHSSRFNSPGQIVLHTPNWAFYLFKTTFLFSLIKTHSTCFHSYHMQLKTISSSSSFHVNVMTTYQGLGCVLLTVGNPDLSPALKTC